MRCICIYIYIFIFIFIFIFIYIYCCRWSYDIGLIHMVGMSTEENFTIGSEQWLWLENDLKNCDRNITPWIVFGGHRPMYINSDYGGTDTSDITVMNDLIGE